MAGSSPSFGRFSGVAAAASTAVVVGGRLGYRAYEDHRTAMARGTCVSAAADLDRAAKECRNLLGADATKSARPSSIIQIDRSLTAKAGRLGLKVPKLKGEVFESAVIERHRRREESVDPPLSRQVPGSMTNSRKRTDHRAMDGHGPKCTSFRALPRRSQLYRGY